MLQSADAGPPATPPFRRHVLYLAGYDPQGADRYWSLFAREAARFAALWDIETAVGGAEPTAAFEHAVVWRATTRMDDATVETDFEYLRWDDLVAADFRTPLPHKLAHGAATLWDAVGSGTLLRVARAAPWFALAWIYPFLMVDVCAGLGLGGGLVAASLASLQAIDWLVGLASGGVIFALALMALQRSPLFAIHLLDDWIAQRRIIRGTDPAVDLRLDAFAARLRAVVAAGGADEIVVVGHSSGGFLGVDVVARALDADPELCRRDARIALLTLGSPLLLIALHPRAERIRAKVERVASEPSLFWAEVAGRFDALCFPERDPLAELGLAAPEPCSLSFRRVSMKRMLTQPTIRRLALRLKVFRIHFQYVMANEIKGPYDFFALVCGARTVRSQLAFRRAEPMSPFPARAATSHGLRGT